MWDNIPCLLAAEYPVSILHLDSIQCQEPAHKKEKKLSILQIAQVWLLSNVFLDSTQTQFFVFEQVTV